MLAKILLTKLLFVYRTDEGNTRLWSRHHVEVPITVEDDCVVNFVEHVEVSINVKYSRRGALEIYLVSPQGKTFSAHGSLVF